MKCVTGTFGDVVLETKVLVSSCLSDKNKVSVSELVLTKTSKEFQNILLEYSMHCILCHIYLCIL